MPRAAPNPIEAIIETVLPRPVIDIFSALGRLVYSIVLSRRVDPDSWQDALIPPLIALLLAYGSLLIAYRTVRNSFNLAWYGVKYGALIGAVIAIYAWYTGTPDAGAGPGGNFLQNLAGPGGAAGGNRMFDGILGGLAGQGNQARGGGGGGGVGGALDMLHTLGRLGQGGAAAVPLLSAVMGYFQDGQDGTGGRRRAAANGRAAAAQQQRQRDQPRRSSRLRTNARRANANNRRRRNNVELDDDYEEEYDDELDDDDDPFVPRNRRGSQEDAAIKAVKSVLRWVGQATAPEADGERRPNPLFPQQQQDNDRRRRRRRANPSLFDLD